MPRIVGLARAFVIPVDLPERPILFFVVPRDERQVADSDGDPTPRSRANAPGFAPHSSNPDQNGLGSPCASSHSYSPPRAVTEDPKMDPTLCSNMFLKAGPEEQNWIFRGSDLDPLCRCD